MQKRIVSVVFEGGVMNLGGKIKFGHFSGYGIVNISAAVSELLGTVLEIHAMSADNVSGFFMIPLEKVEGLEYCLEEDTEKTMANFKRFIEEMEARERSRRGFAGPLANMPQELQEFLGSVANDNGIELPDAPMPVDDDDE